MNARLPLEALLPGTKLDGTPSSHPRHLPVDSTSGLVVDAMTSAPLQVDPPLYALGPLRGDNFVRFVVGDAVAVVSDLASRLQSPDSSGVCSSLEVEKPQHDSQQLLDEGGP